MASRRAAFACLSLFNTSVDFVVASDSSSLHSGQRLANPGLPGLSSNSSPQTTQVLIGKDGILISILSRQRRMGVPVPTIPGCYSERLGG